MQTKFDIDCFFLLIFSVAVVLAFFLCWAPFHAQRIFAFYFHDHVFIYAVMTYISGVLYYLSTCINPLLYNIMSNKFREAFKVCKFYRSLSLRWPKIPITRLVACV